MIPGPKPPTPKADAYYSAPRTAAPLSGAGPAAVVSVNYSPNTPTPGGATNGQSTKQS